MNKSFLPQILIIFLIFSEARSQPVFDTVALIAVEEVNTQFCLNNTKLMAGKSMSDRYLVYYNPDTIFLNILQNGTWIRKIAHTGSNIRSATLTTSYDRIWICWKEGPFIKASYTTDKGNTWSDDFSVSPPGNVSAPPFMHHPMERYILFGIPNPHLIQAYFTEPSTMICLQHLRNA